MVRKSIGALVVLALVAGVAVAGDPRQGPVTLLQEKDMKVWFKPDPNKSSVAVTITDSTKFIDSQGKKFKGQELFKSNLSKNDQITVWVNDKNEATTVWFGQHKDEKEPEK
jgi:hypothetical protein